MYAQPFKVGFKIVWSVLKSCCMFQRIVPFCYCHTVSHTEAVFGQGSWEVCTAANSLPFKHPFLSETAMCLVPVNSLLCPPPPLKLSARRTILGREMIVRNIVRPNGTLWCVDPPFSIKGKANTCTKASGQQIHQHYLNGGTSSYSIRWLTGKMNLAMATHLESS